MFQDHQFITENLFSSQYTNLSNKYTLNLLIFIIIMDNSILIDLILIYTLLRSNYLTRILFKQVHSLNIVLLACLFLKNMILKYLNLLSNNLKYTKLKLLFNLKWAKKEALVHSLQISISSRRTFLTLNRVYTNILLIVNLVIIQIKINLFLLFLKYNRLME